MTSTTTRWSSETGTPDPVFRPADPFATIPGAGTHQPPAVAAPTRTVRDNPAFAFRNLGHPHPVLDQLPDKLVEDYEEDLYAAGTAAMALVLPEVWREHGYLMLDCTETAMGELDRGIPDEVFHAVWDAAAERIDADALRQVVQR